MYPKRSPVECLLFAVAMPSKHCQISLPLQVQLIVVSLFFPTSALGLFFFRSNQSTWIAEWKCKSTSSAGCRRRRSLDLLRRGPIRKPSVVPFQWWHCCCSFILANIQIGRPIGSYCCSLLLIIWTQITVAWWAMCVCDNRSTGNNVQGMCKSRHVWQAVWCSASCQVSLSLSLPITTTFFHWWR